MTGRGEFGAGGSPTIAMQITGNSPPVSQLAASSVSMAEMRAGSEGLVSGEKRATTSPDRLRRNFSKFQSSSGSGLGDMPYFLRSSAKGIGAVLMALGCAWMRDA